MTQTLLICGASRGIGREMVRQAAARGDRVIATVRGDVEALQDDADLVLRCDITDEAALTAVAAAAGEIDVLVVNAGVYRGRGGIDADDMGADAWSEVLMTNVAGPFFAVKALLPKLRAPPSVLVDTIGLKATIQMIEKAGLGVPAALANAQEGTKFFDDPQVNVGKFFVAA